jgi:hypothetical protein
LDEKFSNDAMAVNGCQMKRSFDSLDQGKLCGDDDELRRSTRVEYHHHWDGPESPRWRHFELLLGPSPLSTLPGLSVRHFSGFILHVTAPGDNQSSSG